MAFWNKIALTLGAWPLWLGVFSIVAIGWYYFSWLIKNNRIPQEPGLPREVPPNNLSPAVLRYLYVQDVDGDSLIAAVLNAVIKNIYRVRWHKKSFSIVHNPAAPPTRLSRDEIAALTFNGRDYISKMKVSQNRNRLTHKAEVRLRTYISKKHGKWIFPYWQHLLGSLAVSLMLLGIGAAVIGPVPHVMMLPYFMIGWPVVGLCSYGVWYAWTLQNYAGLPIAGIFAIVGFGVLIKVEMLAPAFLFPYLIPIVALHLWYYKRLPRLKPEGYRLHKEVEEFRQFLVQKAELNETLAPPEYYLIPYLVALEVPFERQAFFSELLTKDPGVARLPGSPI